MSKLTFVDVTLRDGNHSIKQQFTPEIAAKVAAALDAAGVDIIEVGHGDGVGGSSIHVGRTAAPYQELIKAVVSSVKRAKVAIFCCPALAPRTTCNSLSIWALPSPEWPAIARKPDITEQHVQLARKLGMFVCGYLISFGMASPQRIVEESKRMESYGAQYVNLAESQGYLVLARSGNTFMRCARR